MTVEGWKSLFDWGTVILLFLTFAFGAGALITGGILGKQQEEQSRQFEKDLTEAKTKLVEQQERTAVADSRVAGLETDAANAKGEMAKQQTRAANAEKALLELQQRLAHRRINKADHDKFVASLRPYRGSVVNLEKLGDDEAARFADDIVSVLRDAEWTVNVSLSGYVAPPPHGLSCSVDIESPPGQALAAILGNLPTINIQHAHHRGFVAEILVGLRVAP